MGHHSELLDKHLSGKSEEEFYFNRVPLKVLTDAWQEAESMSDDALVGLHVGERIHPMDYGLLGQLIMNSETIQDAIEDVFGVEYIINNIFPTGVIIENSHAINRLFCHQYEPKSIRHIVEQDISALINLGVFIMNKDYTEKNKPIEVHFRHQPAHDIECYEKALRCKVSFEQEFNQVIYPESILNVPTYNPSPRVAAILKDEVQKLLTKVERLDSISLRIWRIFQSAPLSQPIDIESVSTQLNMTVRTMQRHLQLEKTSFQEELNLYKGEIAKRLLNNQLAVTQVAHEMGFNDSSAFHKAFKRWTGITPKQFKELQ